MEGAGAPPAYQLLILYQENRETSIKTHPKYKEITKITQGKTPILFTPVCIPPAHGDPGHAGL